MEMKKRSLFKQRMLGLMMIVISIIVPFIDGDATASLICAPFGLYALFTNENILG